MLDRGRKHVICRAPNAGRARLQRHRAPGGHLHRLGPRAAAPALHWCLLDQPLRPLFAASVCGPGRRADLRGQRWRGGPAVHRARQGRAAPGRPCHGPLSPAPVRRGGPAAARIAGRVPRRLRGAAAAGVGQRELLGAERRPAARAQHLAHAERQPARLPHPARRRRRDPRLGGPRLRQAAAGWPRVARALRPTRAGRAGQGTGARLRARLARPLPHLAPQPQVRERHAVQQRDRPAAAGPNARRAVPARWALLRGAVDRRAGRRLGRARARARARLRLVPRPRVRRGQARPPPAATLLLLPALDAAAAAVTVHELRLLRHLPRRRGLRLVRLLLHLPPRPRDRTVQRHVPQGRVGRHRAQRQREECHATRALAAGRRRLRRRAA